MTTVLVAGHLCIDVTPGLRGMPGLDPGGLVEVGPARVALGGCVANTGLALRLASRQTRYTARGGPFRAGNDPRLSRAPWSLSEVPATSGAVSIGGSHHYLGSPALPVLGCGSSGQENTAAQQIEPGPAIHGALEGLDTVHLSFDRARGPWQLQRVLDGGRVAFRALGEASQRRSGHLLQHVAARQKRQ